MKIPFSSIANSEQECLKVNLKEIAFLFLKLGTTAFGGPAAHISMMEEEVVRKRKWLTEEKFLDLLSASNLIPGPNSTELAIHIGHEKCGWPGLFVAGLCFILPAVAIVTFIAWAYSVFGSLPQAQGFLYGIKPVIIAVICQAVWNLGKKSVHRFSLAAIMCAVFALSLYGMNELLLLFAGGIIALVLSFKKSEAPRALAPIVLSVLLTKRNLALAAMAGVTFKTAFSLQGLFLTFLKIGSILYGSGYVLIAFINEELVTKLGWLTQNQLLDAISIGQFTPGPVFTTATFIGYILDGYKGAFVATVGIFLPAFFFVALSGPLIPKIRRAKWSSSFFDGLNVASLALMASVAVQIGHSAIYDLLTILIFLGSFILIVRFKINSSWLIAAGGALGLLLNHS